MVIKKLPFFIELIIKEKERNILKNIIGKGDNKMSRLKKVATVSGKDFEVLCDKILAIALEAQAISINFPYDDSVFDLVSNSPEYQQIIGADIKNIFDKIKAVAAQWAEDTEKNYPGETENE